MELRYFILFVDPYCQFQDLDRCLLYRLGLRLSTPSYWSIEKSRQDTISVHNKPPGQLLAYLEETSIVYLLVLCGPHRQGHTTLTAAVGAINVVMVSKVYASYTTADTTSRDGKTT